MTTVMIFGGFLFSSAFPARAVISNGANALDLIGQYESDLCAAQTPVYTKGNVLGNFSTNKYGLSFSTAPTAGIAIDPTDHRLFVGDGGNGRILVFNLDASNHLVDRSPDKVLGQTSFIGYVFDTTASNFGTTSNFGSDISLAFDDANNRLFATDKENDRVLVFDVAAITDGEAAVNVLGQTDFTSTGGSLTQTRLVNPNFLTYDPTGSRLFVSDDRRVMVYDVASITNGEAAVNVLGQADFVSNGAALTATGMSSAAGLAFDDAGDRLFVADFTYHRVLVYNVASITNGEAAVNVLGQSDFTTDTAATTQSSTRTPHGLAYDATNSDLYVVQNSANRVTVFDVAAITDGENATSVLGQTTFTAGSQQTTQAGLSLPIGVGYAADRLYVQDRSNTRYMIFDTTSITNGENAVDLLGQYSDDLCTLTPVYTKAFQNNVPHKFSISPTDFEVDLAGHRLFVTDDASAAKRVLVFNLNVSNQLVDKTPDFVLGASNFSSIGTGNNAGTFQGQPSGLELVGDNLYVSDAGGNRVLIFDVASITNGEVAVAVLGQPDFDTFDPGTSDTTLSNPLGISYQNLETDRVYVSDNSNHRVVVYEIDGAGLPLDGTADFLLGQELFTDAISDTDVDSLSSPMGVVVGGNSLYVADSANNRVMVFDVVGITDGEDAVKVLGQPNFTSFDAEATRSGMSMPSGVEYDGDDDRLFVADTTNDRTLEFNIFSITNGENATHVLGQSSFTGSDPQLTQAGTINPSGLLFEPDNDRLYVGPGGERAMIFDAGFIAVSDSDLSLTKTVDDPNPLAGADVVYTITVSNAGPDNATNVAVWDELPVGVTYSSNVPSQGSYNSGTGIWTVGTINNGASATLDITATVDAGTEDTTITNVAEVFGFDGDDPDSTPNNDEPSEDDQDSADIVPGSFPAGIAFDNVLGQDLFTGGAANKGGSAGNDGMNNPFYTAYDAANDRLFVADGSNNRVLVYNLAAITDGEAAVNVLGQDLFTDSLANKGGVVSGSGLDTPVALAYDSAGQRLFVSDLNNNRVLVFSVAAITDGEAAVNVLGQDLLTDSASNKGGAVSSSSLFAPIGLTYDSSGQLLYVSDYNNNRVLAFNVAAITNGEAAVNVLGQDLFTDSTANKGGSTANDGFDGPGDASLNDAGSMLFVADQLNSRILAFDVTAITNGEPAVNVLGEPNFTSNAGGLTRRLLNGPTGVAVDDTNDRLYVTDNSNHRVLIFDIATVTDGEPAVNAIGQTTFTSNSTGTSSTTLNNPYTVSYNGTDNVLFVTDTGNNRVLVYGTIGGGGSNDPTLSNAITMSRLKAGETSTVSIGFQLQNTLSGVLTVTFPAGFTVTSAPTGVASSGCLSSFGFTAQTMYATKTNCSGTIALGGGTVTNPVTPGSYHISWVNDDPGGGEVYIIDDDQVTVTANIDSYLTFNVGVQDDATACSGSFSGSGGTLALGVLTTGAVTSSDASGVDHICTRVSTNATAGAMVTVRSLNGASGLVSASAPADDIDSSSATLAAGTENYGICAGSAGGDSGNDAISGAASPVRVSPFAGSCAAGSHVVGGLTTSPQQVWTLASPSVNAFVRMYVKAAISSVTPAHADYSDTLTFIATGTF